MIRPRVRLTPALLYGVALALGLAGLALRVLPPLALEDVRATPASAPDASPLRSAEVRRDSSAYTPVVVSNVFSPTRQPPAVRFAPEPEAGQSVAPPAIAIAKVEEPTLRLLGTTIAPSGAIALLAVDPGPGARIYRVGERFAGGAVASITDSTVVITRTGGRLVLRLPSPKERRQ